MEGGLKMTELRLGLPGGGTVRARAGAGAGAGAGSGSVGGSGGEVAKSSNKRGFYETGDLKLNFSSSSASSKEIFTGSNSNDEKLKNDLKKKERSSSSCSNDHAKPPAKAQVVGWPPVQSFRRNITSTKKSNNNTKDEDEEESHEKTSSTNGAAASFVKVSMDGAPYLRKVDLKMYKSYKELSDALGNMFSSFTIGTCGSQGMKDFMNESKLMDLLNGSDYVPTYEDKDGDWMLVGDVPWEMFVESCKRLRIMKGKEAIGLAPRAMEKCKNRS